MLFKCYQTLKIEKYEFFKISISHILKTMNVRKAIFCLGIRYMLLAYNRNKKPAKNRHVAYFFKLKSILLKNIKANKSFKSRIKMSHKVNTETKNLLLKMEFCIKTYK